MKLNVAAILTLLVISATLYAQSDIPLGSWREHYSYNSIVDVAVDESYVYGSTGSAILILDQAENELSRLTKLSGLTGTTITSIIASNGRLIIGYEDGNLDVVQGNEIVNINSIAKSSLNSSKQINGITVDDDLAYISTDFGVSLVNLEELVLGNSYINLSDSGDELQIHYTLAFNDSLFLATENGILSAPKSGTNLLDFRNWKRTSHPTIDGNIVSKLVVNGNRLFAIVENQGVFEYQSGIWNRISIFPIGSARDITGYGQGVAAIFGNEIWTYDRDEATRLEYSFETPHAVASSSDIIWIGDSNSGLINLFSGLNYIANGPTSQDYLGMQFTGSNLEIFAGINAQLSTGIDSGFSQFNSGFWQDNLDNLPVVISRTDKPNGLYATTSGLWTTDAERVILETNFPEQGVVTAIADSKDGMWASVIGSSLYFLPNNSSDWQEYDINNILSENVVKIVPIPNGDLWLLVSHQFGGGILVYNPNTGQQRWLSTAFNEGELPVNEVTDIEIDKNDQVWVATRSGVAIYPSPQNILLDSRIKPIVPVFGSQFLFLEKEIFDIEIDAGNRKWFSTVDGVWLLDKYGEQLVHHFNLGNSPLPSSVVRKIEINEITGEVFFLSNKGLVSYRGDATKADLTPNSDIDIFPNPVTKEFEGHVGMQGLDENSIVKITDVSGKLIWQTKSQGGTATWNLKDYNGQRAQSGVYLVFSVAETNSAKLVGKIAVVN